MPSWMEVLKVRDKCNRVSDDVDALHSATPVLWASPELGAVAGDTWAALPMALAKTWAKAEHRPSQGHLSVFTTQKERKPEKVFIPSLSQENIWSSTPSVSRISIWQEISWWAKNIHHLRRETQKCIISAASILPDHFTQTPGREKHYFNVRTLNVVHTFGSFFLLRDNCISRSESPGTASR